jgi:transcriptional regulator with XRE-family HTH domain
MQRLHSTAQKEERRVTMDKQYKSVVEMLKDVSDNNDFNKTVEKEINTRQISKALFAMRNRACLNQKQIAERMKCTQGKVSKIENAHDMDISIGDLVNYCSAVNMRLEIGFSDTRLTMVDRVKYHYFHLKKLLDKLIEIAKGDKAMERGVEKFAHEALVNISFGLIECLAKAKGKQESTSTLHVSTPVNLEEFSADLKEGKKITAAA